MKQKLIIRKIFENKFRFCLLVINFSLGMILAMLLFTIGYNASRGVQSTITKREYYNNIYVFDDVEEEINNSRIESIGYIHEMDFLIVEICGSSVECFVEEYDSKGYIPLPGELICGRLPTKEDEIMVSEELLKELKKDPLDCIGKTIFASDKQEFLITGVYAVEDEFHKPSLMHGTDRAFYPEMVILHLKEISNVKQTSDSLRKKTDHVMDYSKEIQSVQKYRYMILFCFALVGVGVITASSMLLYSTLKITIQDNMEYFSMKRAIGYPIHEIEKILWTEIGILFTFSVSLSALLYFGVLGILGQFMQLDQLTKIIGSDVKLFQPSLFVFLFFTLLVLIPLIIVEKRYKKYIEQADVVRILTEAVE